MKWQEVQARLNDIIQVDVMTGDEGDFSATHMPFNRLSVQHSGRTSDASTDMTEEEVYQELVYNPDDEHRLIIVRGPNGAGKSHLIRWMRARLQSGNTEELNNREKIVFIRRIDNTLRGAMRQLLEQDVVSDLQQKERMRQFIQASHVQNEAQLQSTIYYTFITHVETDASEIGYRPADRKRLASLLRDDRVKDFLMRPEGPVMRFYELMAQPQNTSGTCEANFLPEDFTKMRDIMTDVERNSSPDVKSMIRRVINHSDAGKLVAYLNSFSQAVIQSCANIAQGDAEGMIRQLRQDLKKKGKALTILIEDFTTFTGIDSELLKVLSIQHGGEYKELCRVTAIVGITDAYYESRFLDNYKNRVTHQIKVDNHTFGDEETLAQMAARYINAAYLTTAQIKNWYEQGADASLLPYATIEPNFDWESIDINGHKFSLYPFNRKALVQLFERLPEKTPRFFLRDIIRTQMSALVQVKLGRPSFPNVNAIQGPAIQFRETQHASRFEVLSIPQGDKPRLRALLCLWGEGHLREENLGGHRVIGGLFMDFLIEFGFNGLSGIVRTTQANRPTTPTSPTTQKVELRNINRDYQKMVDDIENWFQARGILNSSEDLRGYLRDFLVTSINWQMEGVPAYLANAKLSNTRYIYMEGQRQQNTERDKAIIAIDRDVTGYNVLRALCHWRFNNRGWDFKDFSFFQFKLIDWLESNKDTLVSKVKGEPEATPEWTLQCSMALEYLRLGLMGYLQWQEEDASVLKKLFTKVNQTAYILRSNTTESWSRAQSSLRNRTDVLEKNKELLIMLPNSQMGRVTDIRDTKYLFHRDEIDKAYAKLCKMDWDASSLLPGKPIEREELQNSAARMLQTLLPNIKVVLGEEKKKAAGILKQIKEYLGDDLSKFTWVDNSREMADFLYVLNSTYHISYPTSLRTEAEQIEQGAENLAEVCGQIARIIQSDGFASPLAFFSSDPCRALQKALDTMKAIETIANNEGAKAKNDLAKLQSDDSANDPMIGMLESGLTTVREKVEAIGGDNNA
ncbi:MAG: hypothetical protein VR68_00815 [Peptococcaceae bacterium BRH_c4a]|nr:MAG: hypothetical protein VR68_00815 [Peptococcaceae bacterium BRH_c4a]